jgi:peptide/nickel transport system permease protein
MGKYLLKRVLQAIPLLFLVSITVFFMLRLVPGGPLAIYARSKATPEMLAAMRSQLGLDKPIIVQYFSWLGNALRGDLGVSFDTQRPVLTEIFDRLPATLYLIGSTFGIVLVISVTVGVVSAIKQYSVLDVVMTTVTFIGQALPDFWVGMMLILITYGIPNPATGKPFFPIGGMYTVGAKFALGDWLGHLFLPVLTLGLAWVSWYSRFLRSSMLDVIHEDYIRTARAKGLKEYTVILKHALKNASIPLVTVVALDLPTLVGGALFVEIIFSWPGMGRLFYRAVERRDYAILMGVIMMSSVMIIISSLIADIIYAYLDPRIRYEK